MAQVTEELTEARVRAALKMIDGQAATWRRYEVDDTADECETLAALARAHLANAAAIAAARAEGVAIGAANMRETCRLSVVISAGEAWSRDAVEALDIARQRITTLSIPADADAILRAERRKGAEVMRVACKAFVAASDFRCWAPEALAAEIDSVEVAI